MTNKHLANDKIPMSAPQLVDDLNNRILFLESQNQELRNRILTLSYENRDHTQLIHNLLEQTPFGIVIFDKHCKLMRINKAAESILQIERVKAIGSQCSQIFECYQHKSLCPAITNQENYDRIETSCSNPQKADTHLLRSTVYIKNRNEDIILESFIDSSDIKKAQQSKDDFMAKISHELRTPLNAIMGYSELLNEDLEPLLDEEQKQYLGTINRAGNDMLGLVNRLLDFSHLASKNTILSVIEFDVSLLLVEVTDQLKPELEKYGNRIEIHHPVPLPKMASDRFRVRQILVNLLANACKFAQNSTITLVVTPNAETGIIRFDVIDRGIGMDSEQQKRIFKAFEQADNSRTRNFDGVGLGLTISKETAVLLGGDITVDSKPGEGTSFTVMLPLSIG